MHIGSLVLRNNLVAAPMAGYTDRAFRRLAARMGAGLVTTEMISANGIIRKKEIVTGEIRGHLEESPLCVQIFGSNPEIIGEAARIVEGEGASALDINLGCPVKKARKAGLKDRSKTRGPRIS